MKFRVIDTRGVVFATGLTLEEAMRAARRGRIYRVLFVEAYS